MSLLRRGFRKAFTAFKRRYTEGADAEVSDPVPSPGPGWVGSSLPFQIDNLPRFLCIYIVYCVSGFGFPFFAMRHMMLKDAK